MAHAIEWNDELVKYAIKAAIIAVIIGGVIALAFGGIAGGVIMAFGGVVEIVLAAL